MKSNSKPVCKRGNDLSIPRSSAPWPAARRLFLALALASVGGHALAQFAGSVDPAAEGPVTDEPVIGLADLEDPMLFTGRSLLCGDVATSGTPIAGNAAGDGNSGAIEISGIPDAATVVSARLYWTVLTDNDEVSETGKTISFAGNVVSGDMVGFAPETPCFTQANTVAWTADVTGLVTDPGNGVYAVSGFPGSNNIAGGDFTEGVSLVVTYADAASTAKAVVSYEGLAVTNGIGETLHQTLEGFTAGGAVSATWIPVVGNGQVIGESDELLEFVGGAGAVNFDGSLDGGTGAFAAGTCSYLDQVGNTQCYWDDDLHDVSAAVSPGDVFADVNYELAVDCHSFVAMDLAVSVDDAGACGIAGEQVDAACPPTDMWKNHGEYVSCVAHATEEALAGLTCLSEEQLDDISGCVVSERAKSDVGKPNNG
ncbi:MAG: DUF3344 domain-containing protein [Xanthomonadales bacterium]|jgi:hypothetical protein|nr:DUF3344 domain-containing protein [Xanthomonadales bacterium]